jgi:hypothetical protein
MMSEYKIDFKEQVMNLVGIYTHSPLALLLRDKVPSDFRMDAESLAVWGMIQVEHVFLLGCKLTEFLHETHDRKREINAIEIEKKLVCDEPIDVNLEDLLHEADYVYATILRLSYYIYFHEKQQNWKQYQSLVDYVQYLDFLITVIDKMGFFGFTDDMDLIEATKVGRLALETFLTENKPNEKG